MDAAYTLIQHNNPNRLEAATPGAKKLHAAKDSGGQVSAQSFTTGIKEAKWVAAEIHRLIDEGAEPKDIAILSRTSSALEEFAHELQRAGVPYLISQTDGLLKTRVAIDILSMLRVALDRSHSSAWYQVAVSRISTIGCRLENISPNLTVWLTTLAFSSLVEFLFIDVMNNCPNSSLLTSR